MSGWSLIIMVLQPLVSQTMHKSMYIKHIFLIYKLTVIRALGDVVFVEVPIIGDTVKKNGNDKRDTFYTMC